MSNLTSPGAFNRRHHQSLSTTKSNTKSKTSSIPRSCANVYFTSSNGRAILCQILHGNLHLTLPTPKISSIRFTQSIPINLRLHCLLHQHPKGEVDQSARSISSVLRLFFIHQIQYHQHFSELPRRSAFNLQVSWLSCIAICSMYVLLVT